MELEASKFHSVIIPSAPNSRHITIGTFTIASEWNSESDNLHLTGTVMFYMQSHTDGLNVLWREIKPLQWCPIFSNSFIIIINFYRVTIQYCQFNCMVGMLFFAVQNVCALHSEGCIELLKWPVSTNNYHLVYNY